MWKNISMRHTARHEANPLRHLTHFCWIWSKPISIGETLGWVTTYIFACFTDWCCKRVEKKINPSVNPQKNFYHLVTEIQFHTWMPITPQSHAHACTHTHTLSLSLSPSLTCRISGLFLCQCSYNFSSATWRRTALVVTSNNASADE